MASLYHRDEDTPQILCQMRSKLDLDLSRDQLVVTKFWNSGVSTYDFFVCIMVQFQMSGYVK